MRISEESEELRVWNWNRECEVTRELVVHSWKGKETVKWKYKWNGRQRRRRKEGKAKERERRASDLYVCTSA